MASDGFPSFYEAVHGYAPFPWQVRLAEAVVRDGAWPDLLALPTAAGKTSTLDVALWALAHSAERAPRRVVMVVDRRVIVDQGAEHARLILERLTSARGGILGDVSDRLRELWGAASTAPPFQVAVLRGGMPRDDAWARRPDTPVLAFSTVDQVGSRLLFRGYGVSDRMASVHAGLFGHDTLFLLDEVHLSVPFAETLTAIRDTWRRSLRAGLPDRWGVVQLTATPVAPAATQFALDADDLAHPVLSRRLGARKPANLLPVVVAGDEAKRRRVFAEAVAEAARGHRAGGAAVIGVVVNRVDTARNVFLALSASDEAVLLTGRMRPLDRDAVLAGAWPRIRCGRPRDNGAPLYVVATQSIEAGADLDFDAVVTECASLDALRQRFGRLDRQGVRGVSHATILVRSDSIGADDPVYGTSLSETWTWLKGLSEVDFGVQRLPAELAPPSTRPPVVHAPVLLPGHLDAWVQTSPRPEPEPDPALWLHGPVRSAVEVNLVWRADVEEADLGPDGGRVEAVIRRLEACPPGGPEALSVPLSAARQWLRRGENFIVADVPTAPPVDDRAPVAGTAWSALRWAGDGSGLVGPDELRPGDTLVVPAARGGITAGNWDPDGTGPVADHGDRVQSLLRGRPTLRLDPRVYPDWPTPPSNLASDDADERLDAWLEACPEEAAVEGLRQARDRRLILFDREGATGAIVARRRRRAEAPEVTTEDDRASYTGRAVTLATHLGDVARWASELSRRLGWPGELVQDVVLAARLHDVGKADPRFQRMLLGGSEVRAALLTEPLAKSSVPVADAAARRIAQERAGYPAGYRHELLSVSLVEADRLLLADAADPELVLHLVGSHHGWCRPFAPAMVDEAPVGVSVVVDGRELASTTAHLLARLDSGVSDRFWSLTERYGWWGLAWLEAVVRLADHRASEEEEGA